MSQSSTLGTATGTAALRRPFDADREVEQIVLSSRMEGLGTPPSHEKALREYARGHISRAEYLRRCDVALP
jgi:hypothetical protein